MEYYAIRFGSCEDFRREKVEEGRNAIIMIYMYMCVCVYIYRYIYPHGQMQMNGGSRGAVLVF
jgi:hypothetical protein